MEPQEDTEGAEGASALALKRAAMERYVAHCLARPCDHSAHCLLTHPPLRHPAVAAPLALCRQFQHLLDKSTVFVKGRWIGFGVAMLLYLIRVYFVNGWYIITYGLGIYLLNLFIGFLSPQVSAFEAHCDSDGRVQPGLAGA